MRDTWEVTCNCGALLNVSVICDEGGGGGTWTCEKCGAIVQIEIETQLHIGEPDDTWYKKQRGEEE